MWHLSVMCIWSAVQKKKTVYYEQGWQTEWILHIKDSIMYK